MLISGSIALFAGSRSDEASIRRAKARHYYLSGAKNDAAGKSAEAAELYKKAYEADSTYVEAAFQYGIRRFGMPVGSLTSSEEREYSKSIVRKFNMRYPGDIFPNLIYSNLMEQSEELEESIAVLEKMRRHNPGNSDILGKLSSLYLDVGESDKAMEALDDYARIEGEDNDYFVRKAGMRLALGDTVGALKEADRMIAKSPKNPVGVAFKARLLAYFQMNDSALVNFRRAENLSKPGESGNIKSQMAEFYLSLGDSVNYDKKTYEALLEEDLDFSMKHDLLAYYLQQLIDDNGDRTRGDKLFGVLLEQYPHEPELLSLAAKYSAAKKEYAKALEDIDYALDLEPTNNGFWNQALMYCMMTDDYDKADEYFKRAKKSLEDPEIATYSLAGLISVMGDRSERALEIYKEALEKYYPGQQIGEPLNIEALRETLTADGVDDLASLYLEIGDAYFKTDDKPRSFASYENSLMLNGGSPLTLNNYAYFLVKDGKDLTEENLRKADEMSQKAITLSPDNPVYLDTRAWVLFRKGEYKEAKETMTHALELMSPDADDLERAEYLEHLGDILFMNHEPEAALETWKEALTLNPENEVLKRKVKHKTFFYE